MTTLDEKGRPDLDRIAREIADQRWLDTFEKHALAKDILAALRRVEAETREEAYPDLTEDLVRATLRAGYLHVGASEREADLLVRQKMSDTAQMDLSRAQYAGLISAIRTSKEGDS